MWTYSGSYTLARATRDNADWQKLYAWWNLNKDFLAR
jgi:hypothetical protein